MQFVFLIGVIAGLAYFTFKLVRIWQESQTVYANISMSLTVFDALSILSLGACGVWAVWVGSGFDQGLKQAGMPFIRWFCVWDSLLADHAIFQYCGAIPAAARSHGSGGPNRSRRMLK